MWQIGIYTLFWIFTLTIFIKNFHVNSESYSKYSRNWIVKLFIVNTIYTILEVASTIAVAYKKADWWSLDQYETYFNIVIFIFVQGFIFIIMTYYDSKKIKIMKEWFIVAGKWNVKPKYEKDSLKHLLSAAAHTLFIGLCIAGMAIDFAMQSDFLEKWLIFSLIVFGALCYLFFERIFGGILRKRINREIEFNYLKNLIFIEKENQNRQQEGKIKPLYCKSQLNYFKELFEEIFDEKFGYKNGQDGMNKKIIFAILGKMKFADCTEKCHCKEELKFDIEN